MWLDGFIADKNGDLNPLYPDQDALTKSDFLREQVRTTGAVVMGRNPGGCRGHLFQLPADPAAHRKMI